MPVMKIKPVSNNMEKRDTYAKYTTQLKRAMKSEFYFEAIMIEYALIEDELRSIIYHLGLLRTRKDYKIGNTKQKKMIKELIEPYLGKKEKNTMGMTMSAKLKIIRCLCKWAEEGGENASTNKYLDAIYKRLEKDGLYNSFFLFNNEVTKWKDLRNELVHALMNKNIQSVEDNLMQCAEDGERLYKELGKIKNKIKNRATIRKAANLPIE